MKLIIGLGGLSNGMEFFNDFEVIGAPWLNKKTNLCYNVNHKNLFEVGDYDLNCGDFGVEPIKDLFDRCRDFLDDIGDYDNVMIVSHSAVLRCLYHLIVGTELKGYLGDKKIPNLEVIELEYEKKH